MAVVAGFGGLLLLFTIHTISSRLRSLSFKAVTVFRTPLRSFKVVRFPNLVKTVQVHEIIIDSPNVPVFSKFCEELPVGMGIKGGIARKILKIMVGVAKDAPHMKAEIGGDYDIDVVVKVDKATKEIEAFIRKDLSGIVIGGLELEPKDIETIDDVADYFLSREDTVTLYFTEEAKYDCQNGLVRAGVHSLTAHYTHVWMCDDDDGTPVYSERGLLRAIIRMLKGHGITNIYAIPDETWRYYRKRKLSTISVFKVLRNFDSKSENFQRAYQHLIDLGIVEKGTRAIDRWGEALWLLNHKMARYGLKFNLSNQTSDEVDLWCDRKKAEVVEWRRSRRANATKTGFLESDEAADIILPDSLNQFSRFMYTSHNLRSFYPDRHKKGEIDEAQQTVGKAIAKFMRTHTLRRISNNFAEFLDHPDLPGSPRSAPSFYGEPLVFVDKLHSRSQEGKVATFEAPPKEKPRDVYIDPVPPQNSFKQMARIFSLLKYEWKLLILGLLLLIGRLVLAIYLPYLKKII